MGRALGDAPAHSYWVEEKCPEIRLQENSWAIVNKHLGQVLRDAEEKKIRRQGTKKSG